MLTLLVRSFFLSTFLNFTKYYLLIKANQIKNDHILLFTTHDILTKEYCSDSVIVRVWQEYSPTLCWGRKFIQQFWEVVCNLSQELEIVMPLDFIIPLKSIFSRKI